MCGITAIIGNDKNLSENISVEEAIAHLSAARPVARKEVLDSHYDNATDSEFSPDNKRNVFKNME